MRDFSYPESWSWTCSSWFPDAQSPITIILRLIGGLFGKATFGNNFWWCNAGTQDSGKQSKFSHPLSLLPVLKWWQLDFNFLLFGGIGEDALKQGLGRHSQWFLIWLSEWFSARVCTALCSRNTPGRAWSMWYWYRTGPTLAPLCAIFLLS